MKDKPTYFINQPGITVAAKRLENAFLGVGVCWKAFSRSLNDIKKQHRDKYEISNN